MVGLYSTSKQNNSSLGPGNATEQTASVFEYAQTLVLLAEEFEIKPRSHVIPIGVGHERLKCGRQRLEEDAGKS